VDPEWLAARLRDLAVRLEDGDHFQTAIAEAFRDLADVIEEASAL
jgi:hypothetical protein